MVRITDPAVDNVNNDARSVQSTTAMSGEVAMKIEPAFLDSKGFSKILGHHTCIHACSPRFSTMFFESGAFDTAWPSALRRKTCGIAGA